MPVEGKTVYIFRGTLEEIAKEINDKNYHRKVVNLFAGPILIKTIKENDKEVGYYEVAIYQYYAD